MTGKEIRIIYGMISPKSNRNDYFKIVNLSRH